MAPFPTTREGLEAAGYKYSNTATCKGPVCKDRIEWWETPSGKKMPLDVGTYKPHWGSCPDRKRY